MKRIFGLPAMAGVLVILGLGSVQEVHARAALLTRQLSRPVGRFFLMETTEGREFASRLIGREFSYTEENVNLLLRRMLSRSELEPMATEISTRLRAVESNLKAVLRGGEAAGAATDDVIRSLLAEQIRFDFSEAGSIRFLQPEKSAQVAMRDAFLAGRESAQGAESGIGPLSTVTGPVFKPGQVLDGADLRLVDFQGVRGALLQLEDARLEFAMLDGAALPEVNMIGAVADGASFRNVDIRGGVFRHGSARGVDFTGARMQGMDLRGLDLRGANLEGARVFGTGFAAPVDLQVRGALFDAETRLPFSREMAEDLGMIFVN